jgi:hypothetical protein
MTMRVQGRPSFYRPKQSTVSIPLTAVGHALLDVLADHHHASRADVVEQLLRRFGFQVIFPPPPEFPRPK